MICLAAHLSHLPLKTLFYWPQYSCTNTVMKIRLILANWAIARSCPILKVLKHSKTKEVLFSSSRWGDITWLKTQKSEKLQQLDAGLSSLPDLWDQPYSVSLRECSILSMTAFCISCCSKGTAQEKGYHSDAWVYWELGATIQAAEPQRLHCCWNTKTLSLPSDRWMACDFLSTPGVSARLLESCLFAS